MQVAMRIAWLDARHFYEVSTSFYWELCMLTAVSSLPGHEWGGYGE
jgi:hypothetical protein